MALRADQVELTRRAVIDTVVELSREPGAGRITVAEVARRSGVSQATIYRHFPSREALVSAAALERMHASAHVQDGSFGLDDQRAYLRVLWAELAADPVLARQAVVSDAGRELRRARFAMSQPLVGRALTALGLDLSSPDGRRLIACLHVLESAHAFLDLHDRQGYSPDDAVDAVMWGQETLLRALGIDPAELLMRSGDQHDEHGRAASPGGDHPPTRDRDDHEGAPR